MEPPLIAGPQQLAALEQVAAHRALFVPIGPRRGTAGAPHPLDADGRWHGLICGALSGHAHGRRRAGAHVQIMNVHEADGLQRGVFPLRDGAARGGGGERKEFPHAIDVAITCHRMAS